MVAHLDIPERFCRLTQAQQKGALTLLQHLSPTVQQQVLNEWNERCQSNTIRRPAAYLYGIAQKACRGEFNELVDIQPVVQSRPPSPAPPPSPPLSSGNGYTGRKTESSAAYTKYQNAPCQYSQGDVSGSPPLSVLDGEIFGGE